MKIVRSTAFALALVAFAGTANAQTYPSRPVRILIPFPTGGDTDGALRIATQHLSNAFGQPFVVESRPGGNTAIAAEAVAKSAPDGYTLFFCGPSTFATNPALYPKLSYDYARDFVPVGTLSTSPYFIVVAASSPARTLREMLALAKAEPDKYSYASIGSGSAMHIAYEILVRDAGVQMLHVPYKGLTVALPDVLSGRVTTLMSGMAVAGAQAKAGKLRVLAVSTAARSSLMPEVPTVAESGVPGYDIVAWFGLFAPAQTPPQVVSRLGSELRSFLATAEAKEAYRTLGHEAFATTPDELGALVKSDSAKFAKVIREAHIKAE